MAEYIIELDNPNIPAFAHDLQLVELIRCNDCKYKGKSVFREDRTEYIVCWNQGYGMLHPADWFCADGEHKEGR